MSDDPYRESIFWIEVDRIKPNPYQPRREFDALKLQELADSIRMYGLLQPLTVTRTEYPQEDGGLRVEYELIAGERRLRASKLAGLLTVPVIIRPGDEENNLLKLELAIIENLQREDLNPIDRAKAFDRLVNEFGFKHIDVGKKIGRSREYVTNTVRLLSLPEHIQQYLAEGKISEGHTRPVMMLNDRPQEQDVLVKEIMLKKLTVREAEAVARRIAQDKVTNKYKIDPEILALERELTERLGTRVHIEPREVGGRVVISYFSPSELLSLLDTIQLEREATRPEQRESAVLPASAASAVAGTLEVSQAEGEPGVLERATEAFRSFIAGGESEARQEQETATGGAADVEISTRDASVVQNQEFVAPASAGEEPVLVPDPTRPLPEQDAPPASPDDVPEVVESSDTDPDAGLHERERSELLDDRPKEDRVEEEDLYSVRNFSI